MNSITNGDEAVTILIDSMCQQPIYEQIMNQIKESILSGSLSPDSPLPSIRALAKELKISVITTKRAYDELEKEGFIYTVAGKGCFVAPLEKSAAQAKITEKIEENMAEIRRIAALGGISEDELAALWKSQAGR